MSPTHSADRPQAVLTSEDLERELNRARTKAWITGQPQATIRFRAWDVERLLGRGGMGGVFLGRAPKLDRNVALKLVGASAVGSDRLAREARALAQIEHPNVVRVHAVDLDGPTPVIEMEYIDGVSLTRWLRAGPPLRSVVEAYISAGRGVAAIHAAGLVHRDIKPDNVLRKPDGGIVVVDLGLAIDEHTEEPPGGPQRADSSADTVLAGTPGYIAPEVLLGERPTAAADQFSLACALYEATAGGLPFDPFGSRETYLEAIRRGVRTDAPTHAPRWLRRVLRRGLQFESKLRFPTADAFLAELERGLSRRKRWWQFGGLGMASIAVASLGWSAATRPEQCPDASAFLTSGWNGATLEPLRHKLHTQDPTAGPQALALLEDALGRAQTRWAREQAATCRARLAEEPTDGRSQCLARVESAAQSHVAAALAEEADVLGAIVGAAEAVERLKPCPPSVEDGPDAPLWVRARRQQLHARLRASHNADVLGHFPEAERSLLELVQDAEGLPRILARAKYQLGHVLGSQDRSSSALKVLDEARALAFSASDDPLLCEILVYQSKVWSHVADRPDRAARDLDLAAACLERTDNRSPLTWADLLEAKGLHAQGLGNGDRAVQLNQQALERRRHAVGSDHYECSKSHHNLGNAWALRGAPDKARAELARALALRARVLGPQHPRVANVLFDLGDVLREQGLLDEAKQHLENALQIYEAAASNPTGLVLTHLALAQVAIDRDDRASAREHLNACAEFQDTAPAGEGDTRTLADRLHTEGVLAVRDGDFESARASFAEATESLRRHDGRAPAVYDSTLRELEMLAGLDRHLRIIERVRREEPWLSEHLDTLDASERGRFAWYIADAAVRTHNTDFSPRYFRVAIDAYTQLPEPDSLQELHWSLAQALPEDLQEARQHARAALAIPSGPKELRRAIRHWLDAHQSPKEQQ